MLQEFFEPSVEVGRPAEQLAPELAELLLLQQQIFADLAVEQLDRVHGQVEPLALADVGGLELGVGPGDVLVGLPQLGVGLDDPLVGGGEGVIGPFQLAVGPGLDARDGRPARPGPSAWRRRRP